MVKNKNLGVIKESVGLLASFFNFKKFEEHVSKSVMVLYSAVFLVLIAVLSYFNNSYINNDFTIFENLIYVILFVPLFLLVLYALFYVFLRSFERNEKNFWESFLVFTSIVFPFFFIGHILGLVVKFISNEFVLNFFVILFLLFFVYFIINLILNFKNYYKTSIFKVITSLILVNILIVGLIILLYISYMINNLG